VLNLATASRTEFEASIADANREILVGITGAHLTVEEGRKTGSFNRRPNPQEGLDDWVDFLEITASHTLRTSSSGP